MSSNNVGHFIISTIISLQHCSTLWVLSAMKMELTECSETSTHKSQTRGNHPKERIRHIRVCSRTVEDQANLCRDGRSQDLPDAYWLLAGCAANKRWKFPNFSLKSGYTRSAVQFNKRWKSPNFSLKSGYTWSAVQFNKRWKSPNFSLKSGYTRSAVQFPVVSPTALFVLAVSSRSHTFSSRLNGNLQ